MNVSQFHLGGKKKWGLEHAPKSIKELIGFRNNKYNLRGTDILKRPKASTTTYGRKSWRFTAPKLWNSLPAEQFELSRLLKTVLER